VSLAANFWPVIDRRVDPGARERFSATCGEIRSLMKGVCRGMPAPQFERLVVEMARVQLRDEPPTSASLADQYFVPRRHN